MRWMIGILLTLLALGVGFVAITAANRKTAPAFRTPDELSSRDRRDAILRGDAIRRIGEDVVSDEGVTIVRKSASGTAQWAAQMPTDAGTRYLPSLIAGEDMILANRGGELFALNASNGEIRWVTEMSAETAWRCRDLLVAADQNEIWAFDIQSGSRRFRTTLPAARTFLPYEIMDVGGWIVVNSYTANKGEDAAYLLDDSGDVIGKFAMPIADGFDLGDDRLLHTDNQIIRLSRNLRQQWATRIGRPGYRLLGGTILRLTNGDIAVSSFGMISDSGVTVVRLNVETGAVLWRAFCMPLMVSHSEYRHRATLEEKDGHIVVTSVGEQTFVEVLDGQTGKQVSRIVRDTDYAEFP